MSDNGHHVPVPMDIDHHVILSDQMSSHMNPNQITNQMVNHRVPTEHRIVNPHPHSFQLPPQRSKLIFKTSYSLNEKKPIELNHRITIFQVFF